ncbi:ShlB/FhaC/HecB family hemolysin secretion/activation protein [Parvularcula marina]|uniref:ShlB/FhaC/HecB family hemolysin secretion/activation protein n=1 Tax=Parvularcula marina TaxID=2292771 RepID=A0A371R7K0_9PROT|nr:ShlB/FhaC/HecB family hemolysin secretion/activation protein [Parvularcula marina]RFB01434.1 ShlB/FhaC/HecB family hemolysin secretion/activation protein [Parvularcula marina]
MPAEGAAESATEAELEAEISQTQIRSVHIMGALTVSGHSLEMLAQPYIGRPLARTDLQELADEISQGCQARGLLLCRADIHPQDLDDGVLEVTLSEGYFDRIEADPELMPLLEASFARTLKERPVSEGTFRREVAMLDEIPGLKIKAIRPRRLNGAVYVLEIEGEYDRIGLRGLATNRGSRRDNPWKAFLGGEIGSILSPADRLSFGVLFRPQAIDELIFVRGRYDTAPSYRGMRFYTEFAASNSSPRSELDDRDVEGVLFRGKSGVRFPLYQREGLRLAGDISFESLYSREEESGLELYEDRLHIFRAALQGKRRVGRFGLMTGELEFSQGLDIFNAGGGSRLDGEAEFSKITFSGLYATPLVKGVVARVGTEAQWANNPLLFTEEFGVGGGKFGRGYDFGEVLGENGVAAYLELARPFQFDGLLERVEPYIYGDGGTTWNEGAGLTADGTVLWSAGGGMRLYGRAGWRLSYEAAMPLSDAPYTLDDYYVRHRLDLSFNR